MRTIVRNFAPGWFAVVMGTGAISIAAAAFRNFLPSGWLIQMFFLAVASLFFLIALIPWLLRWVLYTEDVLRDLHHPVSSAFFPTMPISLIVLGIALEKTETRLFSEPILWGLVQSLWILGAAGILVFGLIILNIFFHKAEIEWQASTLGWLIPPVSALLVPVLGSSLSLHYKGTFWGTLDLLGSLLFLGIGGFLFLFVMSAVLTRYIFYALPASHLTPTIWIGLAPTSLLTILSVRLIKPLTQFFQADPQVEQVLVFLSRPIGTIFLGFALFWFLLALLNTWGVWRKMSIPFALSWWAFIFPLGVLSVANGALYQVFPIPFFLWTGMVILIATVILWVIVAFLTIRGLLKGTIFGTHKPQSEHLSKD